MFEKVFRSQSFQSIAPFRLCLYGILLLALPFFFLFLHFTTRLNRIDSLSSNLEKTMLFYLQKEQRQSVNKACRKYFAQKEKYAFERAFERIELLKKERQEIEKVIHKGTFFGGKSLEDRLAFLKGKENRLCLQEGNALAKFGIQETLETLVHPVEIDTLDLKEILEMVEEPHSEFPQTLIVDFHIKRKKFDSENELFVCNMKILKREFL